MPTTFFGGLATRLASAVAGRSLTFQQLWGSDSITLSANNAAGEVVNATTAMQSTAVWAAVRIIADGIATLPVDTFQRLEENSSTGTKVTIRKPFRPRPRWLDEPNVGLRLSRIDIVVQVLVSLLLRGNAYIATLRDGEGKVVGLTVLNPDQVTPVKSLGTASDVVPRGFIQYRVEGKLYGPMEVLHIRGMTHAGELEGMDPLTAHADTIGANLAAGKFGASVLKNGGLPLAVVEYPGAVSEAGQKAIRRTWDALYGGVGNAGKVGVLTEGAKLNAISLSPEQVQLLETRRFAVSDIARIFGVPPHLLADASGSTSWGTGLAEQNVAFVQHTLRPWVERLEWGLTWLLVSEGTARTAFVKFNVEGLQRGSWSQRLEGYKTADEIGLYTLDEMRAMEDLSPLTPEQLSQMKDLRATKAPKAPTPPADPQAPKDPAADPPPPPPGGKK